MFTEKEESLNQEIRDILIEIMDNASQELQIEIACLIQQIHRLNCLIYNNKQNWLNKLINKKDTRSELTLWLEEIKNMLLILKAGNSNLETVREFRINLQKNINNFQHLLLGKFMNIFLYLYQIKSIPFKIVIGLMITTILSIIVMTLSINTIMVKSLQSLTKDEQFLAPESTNQSSLKKPNDELTKKINLHDQTRHLLFAVAYAASGGVLGSVVSILLRIIEFKDKKYEDASIPFFIGMFKPVIGLILGIFIFSLINSRTIIKIDFNTSGDPLLKNPPYINENFRHNFFLFTCAFLMGFSERFASDLMGKSESIISTNLPNTIQSGKDEQKNSLEGE